MRYPNIDAERSRAGMSVAAMADAIGVKRRTYYSWLKKGRIPTDKLAKIAELFNCSADYLLGR